MTDDEALEFALTLERRVWHALESGDTTADGALLSSDFLGVYPTGFATRADHVGQLQRGPSVHEHTLVSPRLIRIGDEGLLLSYDARYRRTPHDAEERMFVTSLWQRRGGVWVNTFSQDTVADDDHDVP